MADLRGAARADPARSRTSTRTFQAAPLYFLSPDEKFLVPDTRWLPNKNLQTAVVQELLAGPSTWLRDAVTTAIPEGVQLNPEAVPSVDGSRTSV